MNVYLLFKSLHIIGFVAWFAGLFYLVRLFVYHKEAWEDTDENKSLILRNQYHIMESRLFNIIQTPALFLTLLGGIGMLTIQSAWLSEPWMHLKLGLVSGLVFYHFRCGKIIKNLMYSSGKTSSFAFRLFNEVPTLMLIAIVMLAVWKNLNGLWLGLGVLLILAILFFIAAKLYKRTRTKKGG